MADSGDNGPPETPGEPPRKIHPISTLSRQDAVERDKQNARLAKLAKNRELARLAVEANKGPVTSLDGHKPMSLEEARDMAARALGEILLQKGSLRRFRLLLRSQNDKVALAAYELAIQHILSVVKPGSGAEKPTQVIVNNMIARPVQPVTVEVHTP